MNIMLMFDYTAYCGLSDIFERHADTAFLLGRENEITVVLVRAGGLHLLREDTAVPVQVGQLVAVGNIADATPVGRCDLIGVSLCGALLQPLAAEMPASVFSAEDNPGLVELLLLLAEPDSDATPAAQSGWAYSLLCRLADAQAQPTRLPPLVSAAIGHIRENYDALYGVEELAQELGVSKSHLVRVFSACVGVPPGRYLVAVRVQAAKRLLLHRDLPLDAVAGLCGFSGANYLCRVFKQETGNTPRQWRQLHVAEPVPVADQDRERIGQLYL